LVFLVFNTLFNLTSQHDQVRCFQNVARRLTARGVIVIETFVPNVARFVDGQNLRVVRVTIDSVVLEASVHDPVTQTIQYQYITTTRDGAQLSPLPHGPARSISWRGWRVSNCASVGGDGTDRHSRHRVRCMFRYTSGRSMKRQIPRHRVLAAVRRPLRVETELSFPTCGKHLLEQMLSLAPPRFGEYPI
jgi:hypothetical protein